MSVLCMCVILPLWIIECIENVTVAKLSRRQKDKNENEPLQCIID